MRLTLTFLGRSHGVYDTQWEQQERVIWREQGNMPSAHKGNFEKQMEKISEFSAAPKEQMKNFWVNKPESERLRNKVFGRIIWSTYREMLIIHWLLQSSWVQNIEKLLR